MENRITYWGTIDFTNWVNITEEFYQRGNDTFNIYLGVRKQELIKAPEIRCPYCSSEDLEAVDEDGNRSWFSIYCSDCGLNGPLEESVDKAWKVFALISVKKV